MASRRDILAAKQAQRLADQFAPAVREAVEKALLAVRESVSLKELTRILTQRDALALHDLAASLPRRLQGALRLLERETRRAAVAEGATLRAAGVAVRFDIVDQFAVRAAREAAASLVTLVNSETRLAIRAIVTRAFEQGIPPAQMARLIKPLIGLTRAQARTVAAARVRALAEGVARQTIDARLARLSETLLRRRALTIARTETIGASVRGQLATWRAATQTGLLAPGAVKVWITTPDDVTCRFCQALDGAKVPLAGQFTSGRYRVSGPPLHPNCRCALGVEAARVAQRQRRAA